MSLKLLEEIAEGGRVLGEVGSEIGTESKLLEEVSELSIKEAPETLVEGAEDVSQSLKEGSELVVAEAKAGGTFAAIGEKVKETAKYMWDNKGAFAKMMGTEIAKGAFFTVGMVAIEKLFAAKADKDKTPESQQRLEIVRAINKERRIINPIIKDWRTWLADHFDSRKDYGSVDADGVSIEKFQIIQNRISEAQHYSDDTVAKASAALKEDQDMESAKDLLKAELEWVGKVKAISDDMQSKYPLMVTAGLKDNKDEIVRGKKYLDNVNK